MLTGPLACSLPVDIPISAPNPNSAPSENWVEVLCITMALSISVKNNLAFLMMPAVMFVSDILLGFGSWMWLTYPALMLATFISKVLPNKYMALGGSWLVWHVMANAGQWFPPFSPEALLFDMRLLASGLTVVVLYDVANRMLSQNSQTISK